MRCGCFTGWSKPAGKALLPATLFQQATVEHLAGEILRQDDGDGERDVVKVCETGTRAPIFFLHGDLTGGGYYCMKLSRRLGADQPFYTMPPLSGERMRAMPSIEAMAAEHLRTIRSVRPHGPYVIGGFCIGGLIAQELARQLAAEGEAVERLLIIDSGPYNRRLTTFRRMAERLGRSRGWNADRQLYHFCRWHFLAARLERWTGLDLRHQRAIFWTRLRDAAARLRRPLKKSAPAVPVAGAADEVAASSESWFDPRWDVPLVFLWAVGGHQVKPYSGPTTLLLSRDLIGGSQGNPEREWRKHNSNLDSRAPGGKPSRLHYRACGRAGRRPSAPALSRIGPDANRHRSRITDAVAGIPLSAWCDVCGGRDNLIVAAPGYPYRSVHA